MLLGHREMLHSEIRHLVLPAAFARVFPLLLLIWNERVRTGDNVYPPEWYAWSIVIVFDRNQDEISKVADRTYRDVCRTLLADWPDPPPETLEPDSYEGWFPWEQSLPEYEPTLFAMKRFFDEPPAI